MNLFNDILKEKQRKMIGTSYWIGIIKRSCLVFLFASLAIIINFGLQSCSDENAIKNEFSNSKEDSFQLFITLPEAQEVILSKADESGTVAENYISRVSILFFDNDGKYERTQQLSESDITKTGNVLSANIKLNSSDLQGSMYLVANTEIPGIIAGETTLNDVKETVINTELTSIVPVDGFPMSGMGFINAQTKTLEGSLTRLVAKISISMSSSGSEYILQKFGIGNENQGVYLGINDDDKEFYYNKITKCKFYDGLTGYSYPVKSYDINNPDGAYLLLMAVNSMGKECWYRLNLHSGNKTLNIEANHYYKINITSINGEGFSSPEEAMANIEGNEGELDYEIQDNTSGIYSIITDGVRELGVSDDFVWNEEEISATIMVKWASPFLEDLSSITDPEIISDIEWLTLDLNSKEVVNSDADGIKIVVITYTLTLNKDALYTGVAKIKVGWKGLTREICISRDKEIEEIPGLINYRIYWPENISRGLYIWNFGENGEIYGRIESENHTQGPDFGYYYIDFDAIDYSRSDKTFNYQFTEGDINEYIGISIKDHFISSTIDGKQYLVGYINENSTDRNLSPGFPFGIKYQDRIAITVDSHYVQKDGYNYIKVWTDFNSKDYVRLVRDNTSDVYSNEDFLENLTPYNIYTVYCRLSKDPYGIEVSDIFSFTIKEGSCNVDDVWSFELTYAKN